MTAIGYLAPVITQDAPILGLLLACLALVFHTSRLPRFAKFYGVVPALLMAYFLPAILNSTGIIEAGEGSSLYYVASRYLLPASLIMFCLSIDVKGIINLGPKALIMFFAATFGIVIGGPAALLLVGQIRPDVFGGDAPDALWRGLSHCGQLDWRRRQPNRTQRNCASTGRSIQRHDHCRRLRSQPLDAFPADWCWNECGDRQTAQGRLHSG